MKATGIDHSQSIAKTVWDAVPSLLLIVIVIGGIVSGIFTATEGAGVAVLYCLILSIVYKSIDFKGFLGILLNSANVRHHPVPDFCLLRYVLCYGLLRYPGSHLQRPDEPD